MSLHAIGNLIQIQLKRNGMQNGGQGIKNMFMNMVLKFIFINIDPKKHLLIGFLRENGPNIFQFGIV
jgi:hypothetical protein